MTSEKSDYFTKTDLKARAWTDASIKKFLGEPDELRPNPKYPNAGSPMAMFKKERVVAAEEGLEFKAWKEGRNSVRAAAAKAVETKRQQLEKIVDDIEEQGIELPDHSQDELIDLACKNYYERTSGDARAEDWDRHCVNYLRHKCTHYDRCLDGFAGKVGKDEAALRIKELVLEAIAVKYPFLDEECTRQAKAAQDNWLSSP